MNIEEQLLSSSHRLYTGRTYKKTTITAHSTGNANSTAQNERDWLDNESNTRDASWNYVVAEDVIIQALPDDAETWHCSNSTGNKHSLSVEICESGDRKKTLLNATEFIASKLKELNLTVSDLRKHYDWSGKNCPRILIYDDYIKDGMDWNWFVNKINEFMKGDTEMVEKINMIVNGQQKDVDRILVDGTNYIKIRDVADSLGFDISNIGSIPVLTKK
jgi:N-acetylmuramoyl-L-alanine amidase CwlA